MDCRRFFRFFILLTIVVIFSTFDATSGSPNGKKLREVFSWKSLEFAFPSEEARNAAIISGLFIPGAAVPIDVDVYTKGSKGPVVFVSIPRIQDGIPATIGYVTDSKSAEGNPIIAPYPNWIWQRPGGTCSGITCVYRIQIDHCERMWVLDTGKVGDKRLCPPQLLSFSLITNELLSRYVFPTDQYVDTSLFVTPAVDIRDTTCEDTFVYIADVTGFGLIVYDHKNSKSWRITNKLFYPYPPYGTFHIKGVNFDLMDGILGLALSPIKSDGDRILYFHSLASRVESWVPTSVLRNTSIFEDNSEANPRSFKPFDCERSSQSAAQAMDKNGVLYFGLVSDLAIGCWNSRDYPEYGDKNIEKIVVDPETLPFASGLKIITSTNGRQEFWVITVTYQKVITGTLSASETNFRIQAAYVEELVRGTKCDVVALGVNRHKSQSNNNRNGQYGR